MNLSDVNPAPLYTVKVPSTGKNVKFRPYLVKEERALLQAQESNDISTMMNTLISIVESCVKPKPKNLTNFDFEFLFTKIRAKSVGETSDLIFSCEQCNTGNIKATIPLDSVQVVFPDEKKDIVLSDKLAIRLKYLPISTLLDLQLTEKDLAQAKFKAICDSIEKVFVGEETIECSEQKPGEVEKFVDNLSGEQFSKLKGFIDNQPYAKIDANFTCPTCHHENKIELKGIQNFF